MKMILKLIFFLQLMNISCSPKTGNNILNREDSYLSYQDIPVLNIKKKFPENAIIITELKSGYNPFKKCNYDSSIKEFQKEAHKLGGNVIKIIEHIPYNTMFSKKSCHKIKVAILKVSNPNNISDVKSIENQERKDYAILKIYRYKGSAFLKYDLYLGDSLVTELKSDSKKTIYLYKEGDFTLQTDPKAEREKEINIQFGQVYFIKGGEKFGSWFGIPTIEVMDKNIGRKEFESFNAKNN